MFEVYFHLLITLFNLKSLLLLFKNSLKTHCIFYEHLKKFKYFLILRKNILNKSLLGEGFTFKESFKKINKLFQIFLVRYLIVRKSLTIELRTRLAK